MATTLAACELSGYSKSNQTFLWFSLSGKGLSSSLIKPSSSLRKFKRIKKNLKRRENITEMVYNSL